MNDPHYDSQSYGQMLVMINSLRKTIQEMRRREIGLEKRNVVEINGLRNEIFKL